MKRFFARVLCAVFVLLLAVPAFAPNVSAADAPPEISSEAALVMDAQTGQVLVAKNADLAEYPASITKIMTLALVLEQVAADYPAVLDTPIEVSYSATHSLIYGAAHVSLTEGEVVSLRDLLYAAQISSANDAANMLAEYAAGSIEAFADRMNQKAAELGLAGSHFVNPSGLPDANHYTTAYDMAAITRWALSVPGFRDFFCATSYEMPPTNKQPAQRPFNTSNLMLIPGSTVHRAGVTGSKTGYTTDARYTLVTSVQQGDTELICVVLKSEQNSEKYDITNALLDYGFNNFSRVGFPASALQAGSVPVYGGGPDSLGEITVCAGEDIPLLLHNSLTIDDIAVAYQLPEKYVIGESFRPAVTLSLEQECSMQPSLLVTAPLAWNGLDAILANNTTVPAQGTGAWKMPAFVGVILTVLGVLVLLVAARILYVRHRRKKRKQARLAYVQAHMPIRIAQRPQPPARRIPVAPPQRTAVGDPRRTARSPQFQVVGKDDFYAARRAGRR